MTLFNRHLEELQSQTTAKKTDCVVFFSYHVNFLQSSAPAEPNLQSLGGVGEWHDIASLLGILHTTAPQMAFRLITRLCLVHLTVSTLCSRNSHRMHPRILSRGCVSPFLCRSSTSLPWHRGNSHASLVSSPVSTPPPSHSGPASGCRDTLRPENGASPPDRGRMATFYMGVLFRGPPLHRRQKDGEKWGGGRSQEGTHTGHINSSRWEAENR